MLGSPGSRERTGEDGKIPGPHGRPGKKIRRLKCAGNSSYKDTMKSTLLAGGRSGRICGLSAGTH